jgi:hypothetical protein
MVMVAIVGTWVSQEVREFLRTVGLLDPHGVTELKTHRSDGSGCDRWRYRLTASIGVVITPIAPLVGHLPPDVIEELITIATSNVYVARTKGGQRTRATADPRLTSLEDVDSSDKDDDGLTA